jgi:ribosomal protein L40E
VLLAARLAALAVSVAALIGVFRAAAPIFGKLGDDLASRVVVKPEAPDRSGPSDPAEAPPPGKCPKCGVLNDEGSEYCRFCGRHLAQDRSAPKDETQCAACGARLSLPARFCSACGKPVPASP